MIWLPHCDCWNLLLQWIKETNVDLIDKVSFHRYCANSNARQKITALVVHESIYQQLKVGVVYKILKV